mmetsp:Transcript_61647/g.130107  ORF Transcript_61647/g.130107 Transcript_61647/m.130107 type:complete len:228 (+) Transcript_61647:299-982(+)
MVSQALPQHHTKSSANISIGSSIGFQQLLLCCRARKSCSLLGCSFLGFSARLDVPSEECAVTSVLLHQEFWECHKKLGNGHPILGDNLKALGEELSIAATGPLVVVLHRNVFDRNALYFPQQFEDFVDNRHGSVFTSKGEVAEGNLEANHASGPDVNLGVVPRRLASYLPNHLGSHVDRSACDRHGVVLVEILFKQGHTEVAKVAISVRFGQDVVRLNIAVDDAHVM